MTTVFHCTKCGSDFNHDSDDVARCPKCDPVLITCKVCKSTLNKDGSCLCTGKMLLERIKSYLSSGGLFNPEMMEHDKVRDLIVDVRDYLDGQITTVSTTRGGFNKMKPHQAITLYTVIEALREQFERDNQKG
jgi:hypothetical protein